MISKMLFIAKICYFLQIHYIISPCCFSIFRAKHLTLLISCFVDQSDQFIYQQTFLVAELRV